MKIGYKYSLILHFILLITCLIKFPSSRKISNEDVIITLESLPIANQTNVQQAKKLNNTKNIPPKLKDVRPSRRPIESNELSKPKVEKKKSDSTSRLEKTNVPRETLDKDQKDSQAMAKTLLEEAKPVLEEKIADQKENISKEEINKEIVKDDNIIQDFDSLLKDLATQEILETVDEGSEKGANKSKYNESMPLSLSEKDAIKSQIIKCWSIPAGGRDVKDMYVIIAADVEEDGIIKNIAIKERSRYSEEKLYDVFVESAIRALQKCSPLQGLPIEKYGSWQKLELRFDPKELIY